MTLDQAVKAINGYYAEQRRTMQRDWEIARWQVMHFVAPYSKKKTMTVTDIAQFEWEKKEVVIPDRNEVIEKIEKMQRWERRHGR
jgi:CO dehydrogenase/acetyl-CoA synthase alpha subunit